MIWQRRVYLDHASTTPVDRRVFRAMKPYFSAQFSNPGALCEGGREAKLAVSAARKSVAGILGARSEEIFFTASGTESNNLALLGSFRVAQKVATGPVHVITGATEHASVFEVCKQIEREGGEVTIVPVGEKGIVSPRDIEKALRPNTLLVSIMHANNEIGTISPVHEISRIIRRYEREHAGSRILFHTDASQSANYLPLRAESLGVDLMTLDASKIYGPKGVGILYKKKKVTLQPIIFGGGQEAGLRSGTENVAGIVGAAKALELVQGMREKESARLAPLRDYFIQEILKAFPTATLNGDPVERLPNNINICFPGTFAEFSVVKLDLAGISCSSASACTTAHGDTSSSVVKALGKKDCAQASLRFTLGRSTTRGSVRRALKRFIATLG